VVSGCDGDFEEGVYFARMQHVPGVVSGKKV
jgi:hypothetical protein